MSKEFNRYKEELDQVKLTPESKRELLRALAEHEPGKAARRPGKRVRMVLIAAVLVLGALVLTAAALPGFWSMLGVRHYAADPGNGNRYSVSMFGNEVKEPVEVAEGRVWFVFDGQHIDITGQFDEEHAFVYETTNPETGLPNYILVGWSAGGIGYGEIVFLPEETDNGLHPFSAHTLGVVRMDPDYPIFDHTYPVSDPRDFNSGDWFTNAVEEICAPYLEQIRPPEGTYETQPPPADTASLPQFP